MSTLPLSSLVIAVLVVLGSIAAIILVALFFPGRIGGPRHVTGSKNMMKNDEANT